MRGHARIHHPHPTRGPTGLAALNGYDGSAIWSLGGEQKDIAIAGEKLFSLEGSGRVLSYSAPDNLAPPITTLTASPGLPDGLHGYYVTRPTFSLSGRDVESYVRESGYRMGDGAAVTYAGPVALPEGSTQVLYWSIDSAGWREGEKLASFQVDLGKPQVSAALSGIQGPLGVYGRGPRRWVAPNRAPAALTVGRPRGILQDRRHAYSPGDRHTEPRARPCNCGAD